MLQKASIDEKLESASDVLLDYPEFIPDCDLNDLDLKFREFKIEANKRGMPLFGARYFAIDKKMLKIKDKVKNTS